MFYNLYLQPKTCHISTWLSWILCLQKTSLHHFSHTFTKSNGYTVHLVNIYSLWNPEPRCFIVWPQCSAHMFSHLVTPNIPASLTQATWDFYISCICQSSILLCFHIPSRFLYLSFNQFCANILKFIACIPQFWQNSTPVIVIQVVDEE